MTDAYTPDAADRRRPGRPTNAEREARAAAPDRAAAVKSERRRRQGMGLERNLKLHVNEQDKDAAYVYRWANDDGSRIYHLTQQDDWDFVETPTIEGQGVGTRIERVVGKNESGQPEKAYLLRKRKEFFDEDERDNQARLDEQMKALKSGVTSSPQGLSGPTSYVPSGGISIRDN